MLGCVAVLVSLCCGCGAVVFTLRVIYVVVGLGFGVLS